MIAKIVAIGLTAAILSILLKKYKPEFSLLIGIIAAVAIFFIIAEQLAAVVATLSDFSDKSGVDSGMVGLVLKIIGVAYLSQFGADVCADAGEGAIAKKIELAGKVVILAMTIPVISGLLKLITNLL